MTDQEINIAVAEACGLDTKRYQTGSVFHYRDKRGHMIAALPNYAGDLNAMHEAEKTLDYASGQRGDYWAKLTRLVAKANESLPISEGRGEYHATARQRAEAFLRTIGKWKESSK